MELINENDKRLKRKAKRVDKIDDKIRNIAANMVETMIKTGGIGLAANQVGILKQIIIVRIGDGESKVMINPEIIFSSEEIVNFTEGCLSFPGKFLNIKRPDKITVKYRCLSGQTMLETHEGLVARIIQHEIDHLNGIVFVEK